MHAPRVADPDRVSAPVAAKMMENDLYDGTSVVYTSK